MFRTTLAGMRETLFGGEHCLTCSALASMPLCASCRSQFQKPNMCRRCGSFRCNGDLCSRLWLPYRSRKAATVYDGSARDLVLAMKRSGRPSVFGLAADELTTRLDLEIQDAVVSWIPSGSGRRERGFDQGRELARAVARRAGVPAISLLANLSALRQHSLNLDERLEQDCYRARSASYRRVILIDDVTTTGATMYFAALALREMGVHEVHAIAFAATNSCQARLVAIR